LSPLSPSLLLQLNIVSISIWGTRSIQPTQLVFVQSIT